MTHPLPINPRPICGPRHTLTTFDLRTDGRDTLVVCKTCNKQFRYNYVDDLQSGDVTYSDWLKVIQEDVAELHAED